MFSSFLVALFWNRLYPSEMCVRVSVCAWKIAAAQNYTRVYIVAVWHSTIENQLRRTRVKEKILFHVFGCKQWKMLFLFLVHQFLNDVCRIVRNKIRFVERKEEGRKKSEKNENRQATILTCLAFVQLQTHRQHTHTQTVHRMCAKCCCDGAVVVPAEFICIEREKNTRAYLTFIHIRFHFYGLIFHFQSLSSSISIAPEEKEKTRRAHT